MQPLPRAVWTVCLLALGCTDNTKVATDAAPMDAAVSDARLDAQLSDHRSDDVDQSVPDLPTVDVQLPVPRIEPTHGPAAGGQRVIVTGLGFDETTVVLFDDAPAMVSPIDESHLSVETPAGDAGPADVRVVSAIGAVTLPAAYTYDALTVDPPVVDSLSGQTITITAAGTLFSETDAVAIDGSPCADLVFVSGEELTCRAPPRAPGPAAVSILRSDGSHDEATFIYRNLPNSPELGFKGGPIDGELTVTVLHRIDGPLEDAYVMLGFDRDTIHQGRTDVDGKITFSDAAIQGPQTITVYKDCYLARTLVDVNAREVDVPVPFNINVAGCDRDDAPPTDGLVGGSLRWPGVTPRADAWDNLPTPGDGEERLAFVMASRFELLADPPAFTCGPSAACVREIDGTAETGYPYMVATPPGRHAIYVYAGIRDTATDAFTPHMMGVTRNITVPEAPQLATGVDIDVDIALDRSLSAEVTRPEPGPFALMRLRTILDLGRDGFVVRPFDVVDSQAPGIFGFGQQPPLTGPLADARVRVVAQWLGPTLSPLVPLPAPLTALTAFGLKTNGGEPVVLDDWLQPAAETTGTAAGLFPNDLTLRWQADPTADYQTVLLLHDIGFAAFPVWEALVPGDVEAAQIPDLSHVPDALNPAIADLISFVVRAVRAPGFDYQQFDHDASEAASAWTTRSFD